MASQDAWAKPLADELVSVFRVNTLMYVRRVSGGYDPTTGAITNTETTYAKAGAITKRMREENQDGEERYDLEVWMALSDIDETYPTFNDHFVYEDRTFKIQQIDPIYSGDTKYAVKCRARAS